MTHEYVIATGGSIMGVAADDQAAGATGGAPAPTAIAWAADRILAVGSDEAVRAISRGDSTFIDLAGCAVTPAPADIAAAEAAVRAGEDVARVAGNAAAPVDLCAVLAQAGLLEPGVLLEPGAPAELAFWSHRRRRWRRSGGAVADRGVGEGRRLHERRRACRPVWPHIGNGPGNQTNDGQRPLTSAAPARPASASAGWQCAR